MSKNTPSRTQEHMPVPTQYATYSARQLAEHYRAANTDEEQSLGSLSNPDTVGLWWGRS